MVPPYVFKDGKRSETTRRAKTTAEEQQAMMTHAGGLGRKLDLVVATAKAAQRRARQLIVKITSVQLSMLPFQSLKAADKGISVLKKATERNSFTTEERERGRERFVIKCRV